ncbi:MAG: phosphatidylinositol mannoside acyltransferase [Candidatus Nanopelagicales bacterium]
MESPSEFASYLAYSVGWRAVRLMPQRVAYRTFSGIADQAWRQQGSGAVQLQRNLARVLPDTPERELRDLGRAGMQSYFRYWCDVFRLPDQSRRTIQASFDLLGKQQLHDALAAGTGAIVVLPHAGNWDHAGAYAALEFDNLVSVAEDLKPERLTSKFLEFRESLGMEILTLRKGEDVFGQLVELVGQNKVIALLGDRDLTSSGVPVEFFGDATRMPAGPAALAHATGAPLFAATLWYEGPMAMASISRQVPVDLSADRTAAVRQTTQHVADMLAEGIAEHPVDWHMLQRLWLADLDQSRLKASKYDLPDADPGADSGVGG